MGIPAISVEQMRNAESATEKFGIEVLQLMENAGKQVAELAREIAGVRGRTITVMCGKGHNGGDGLVAARFLQGWGADVNIILVDHPDDLKPLVRSHLGTARAIHQKRMTPTESMQWELAMRQSSLIVDGLLGYSLSGDPEGFYAQAIELTNKSGRKVLSIDCPSGLDSDSGEARKPCIKASATIALGLPKRGLLERDGPRMAGKVYVADIGIPPEAYELLGMQAPSIFEKSSIVRL